MPPATSDDYAWQSDWEEIYTVTFVCGHDERETLRRFGVAQADMRPYNWEDVWERVEETAGESDLVVVTHMNGWTIAFEACGWEGNRPETLRELSRGGEAVSVMRHDYAASHHFAHAVDGELRTAFRLEWPQERWGAQPDALNAEMRELGLTPSGPQEKSRYRHEIVALALALASRLSGVLFHRDMVESDALLGGIITAPVPDDPQ
ncbi:DUF6461 domain-containing protein [Microbispora sp. H10836]|uniref:DUF6461 domain-containing protein n=1 Tax=Microbispora sp. H10836 TaxID=2729106 RepID=UPI0014759E60|nr:DUF6461 domain-containing protein [Microbispora sp. H10836]